MLDALVLLGCRMLPGGQPSPAARRRALALSRAYHRGVAPLVVVSGGRRWYGFSEAEILIRELELLDVPVSAIVPELLSLSTCENARGVSKLLRERNLSRVGVVTCDWHLPRALACFRVAGLDAVGIPAPSPAESLLRRARRSIRERVSFVIDRWATWGWSTP